MKDGYYKLKNFLTESECTLLLDVCQRHFEKWKKVNEKFYHEHAINSAYLTDPKWCNQQDREHLFKLFTNSKIIKHITDIFQNKDFAFLNSQLFFDPYSKLKSNYWHRDIQYTELSLSQQKKSIEQNPLNVIHVRIALKDEHGLELIPGSHNKWDSNEELNIRLEKEGHRNFEPISHAKKIPLNAGELLIFSANMIHRGLYGLDRMAIDLLYCERDPEILKYRLQESLPNQDELKKLSNSFIF